MACGLMFAGLPHARAGLVDLDLYVTYSILQNDNSTPLVDGSWVVVVGSSDSVNNGMLGVGNGGTNYIFNSVQGNDVLLGYVFIGDNSFANVGKFFQTFQYDSTNNIGYVYIRYFQTTGPVTGLLYWGQSSVVNLVPTNYGVVSIDIAPNSSPFADHQDNFVVIPEPGSAQLIILAGGLLFAAHMTKKFAKRKASEARAKSGVAS